MAKTNFINGDPSQQIVGTVVTAAFLNSIFNHVHDGVDDDGHAPIISQLSFIPSGTKMVFFQAAAPTGWTQDTAHSDKALRIVSGAGGGSGGTHGFSTAVANGSHTHNVASSGAHAHPGNSIAVSGGPDYYYNGSGGAHIHVTDNGVSSWSPLYIDVIICTKN